MKQKNKGKTFRGVVVSVKNEKTAVVEINQRHPHPIYKKIIKRRKKLYAHTENKLKVGEKVTILETRPLSRLKRFIVLEKGKK